jgi:hypothetical protein
MKQLIKPCPRIVYLKLGEVFASWDRIVKRKDAKIDGKYGNKVWPGSGDRYAGIKRTVERRSFGCVTQVVTVYRVPRPLGCRIILLAAMTLTVFAGSLRLVDLSESEG